MKQQLVDEAVYRYDSESGEVVPAASEVWDQATGEECNCTAQHVPPSSISNFWKYDSNKYEAYFRGRKLTTAGKTVLRMWFSLDRKYMAVLSAAGSNLQGFMPFFGRHAAKGTHYHQVFDALTGKQVGETVALPLTSEHEHLGFCWSPLSRYVIYYDHDFDKICVVETHLAQMPSDDIK